MKAEKENILKMKAEGEKNALPVKMKRAKHTSLQMWPTAGEADPSQLQKRHQKPRLLFP